MDYRERMEGKIGVLFQIADQFLAGQIPPENAAALISNEMANIRPSQLEALKAKLGERLKDATSKSESEKLFELFRNHLSPPYHKLAEGHPLKNYFEENCRVRSVLMQIDEMEDTESAAEDWIDIYESLQEYNIHFKRQEKNFYPLMVQAGLQQQIERAKELHLAIRNAITTNLEMLITLDHIGFLFRQRDLSKLFMDYLDLEERLLYAKALGCLSDLDFAELRREDDKAGYASIDPPPEFFPKEKPASDQDQDLEAEAQPTPDPGQILFSVLEARESGLICYDLSGHVISAQGNMIVRSDLELSGEVRSILFSGKEKRIEAVVSDRKGSWKIISSLIRDASGKPQGFLKIKEKLSAPGQPDLKEVRACMTVDLDSGIAELFEQYPKFKEDFFELDDELKGLKGPYGMELLKDSTIEMVAKSLRIDTAELTDKINQLLQSYQGA